MTEGKRKTITTTTANSVNIYYSANQMSTDVGFKTFLKSNLTQQMLLARQASFDDNMLAQQVAPLAPGYRTALSLRSQMLTVAVRGVFSNSPDCRKGLIC